MSLECYYANAFVETFILYGKLRYIISFSEMYTCNKITMIIYLCINLHYFKKT